MTTNEDTAYTFSASDFNFSDVDGDTLASVKIIGLETRGDLELDGTDVTTNQVITKADIDAGDLTFTPVANEHNSGGYASFVFRVNDGTADSAVGYSMHFNVTPVNDPPTVANAIPDRTATVDTAFSYTFPANTFDDVDDTTLTYTAELDGGGNLPSWLTFTASTRTFSGTPAAADAGTVSVKVTASDDDSATVSDTFVITVSAGASSDATLSDLDLSWDDNGTKTAITLSPPFTSASTSYTASVGNAVDEITIEHEENDSGAGSVILDGNDMTLTDADLNAMGFQVELAEGENTIKVKVTAADNSTETYTVVVTRNEVITVGYDPVAYAVTENGASVTLTVKVTSHATGAPRRFILRVETADGTAVSPSDYGGVSGELIQFNVGDVSLTHTIHIEDETDLEDDETFQATVSLASGDGVTISPATATVTIEGRDASGKPGITGTPQVGETLTATIGDMADGDNLPGSFPADYDFQWVRVDANGTSSPMNIGMNSDEYTPVADDVGKKILVRASFTDGGGAEEQLSSDATADAVAAATGACPANNDWCAEMTVGVGEISGGIDAYGYDTRRYGTYGSLDDTTIDYGGGYTVQGITAVGTINTAYGIFLDAYLPRGSTFDIGGAVLTANASSENDPTQNLYEWIVSGGHDWIEGQIITVSANLAPIVTGATVNGNQLVLTFAEDLDTNSKPAASAFTVYVDGGAGANPSSVDTISGDDVTLTLATAVTSGQTVTLDYAVPGTNPLRDESELDAPGFTGQTVTNNTGNTAASGAPTITGTAQAGQTLTAAKGTITDSNGTTKADNNESGYAYTYEWFRVDTDGTSNKTLITGATASTYTLTADEVGKKVIVEASFTDDADYDEGPLPSAAYPSSGAVTAAANTAATGAPAITGTAREGMTLSAGTDDISDAEGKAKAENGDAGFAYTYKWFRVGSNGTSNKTEITGATSRTYVLTAAEVGNRVIVEASFTDDAGNPEGPLPSAAYPSSGTVISNDTNPPTVETASVNRATLTIVFSESLAAAPDLANGAFEVKKTPAGGSEQVVALAGSPAINGATLTLTLAAAVVHTDTDVKVSYTRPTSGSNNRLRDAVHNEVDSFTDFAVNNQTPATNTPATGKPAVTGTARVGQTLTAGIGDIDDEDGLPSTFPDDYRFQWVRVDADGTSNPRNVGADSATYRLVAADEGKRLRVDVTFTDDGGTQETRQSDATAVVESPDRTAPSVASATVNGDSLIIYFDEDLAAAPNLANSAFTVKKTPLAGSEETVGLSGDPSISGARVTLTLAAAVDSTDGSVKVSYARPSSGSGNRLEDPSGNEAASFTDQAVTNITPAPGQESAVSTWYVYFDRTEYTASEGGAGARVTVRLNAPWKHAEALKVMLSTTELNGGASEADFRGVPASVTFQPGQTAVSFTVRATNDNEDDDGESIRFGINTRGYHDETTGTTRLGVDAVSSHPEDLEHLKTGQGPHTVTVHLKDNNGPRAVTVSFGEGAYTATEGGADATVEVRLSERPGRQLVVPLTRTHNGAGTGDYSGVPESLTFGSNENAKTLVVEAVDDSDDDDLESVTLGFGELPSGVSAGSPARTVVNLDDNDEAEDVESIEETAQPKLTLRFGAADTRVAEVREGISFSLAVTLDGTADTDVHIPLEVAYTGGATAADVTGLPATLTIEAGQRRTNTILRMVDDAEVDPGEGFTVTFGALPAGVKADERYDEARFTIIDNDIPEINVFDARANEPSSGRTVWLRFKVTLSRSFEERVRVNYATVDGTARAGEDYEAASGTLVFPEGDTEKYVRVKVLDDDHDEGTETLTLVLSGPVNAALGDNTAEGRITNTDRMPGAWLTRFGRAASDASIDAIGRRMNDDPPASHLTLGGGGLNRLRSFAGALRDGPTDPADPDAPPGDLPSWERMDLIGDEAGEFDTAGGGRDEAGDSPDPAAAIGGPAVGGLAPRRREDATRSGLEGFARMLGVPDPRQLLMGSSFFYSPGERGAGPKWLGSWSAWGETSAQRFRGAEGTLNLDGELATATLGFDTRRGRWLAGLALSYTEGRGGYTRRGAGGEVASSLTSLNPYLRYALNERTDLWGVLGYGVGDLSLTPERADEALEAGLSNALAAFGGRTALAVRSGSAGRFELALRSDARFTQTASGTVEGLMGAEGSTGRVRMLLEGSGKLKLASGGVLKPTLQAGLRYDGGDAETGAGLEVGGGLGYAAGRLKVRIDARVLLAHEDADYIEWGFGGSVAYTPNRDGRGLHLKLGSSWGDARSNAQALWSRETAHGLAQESAMDMSRRLNVDIGYSLPGRDGHALWTPYVGARAAGAGRQMLRVGVKLTSGTRARAELEIGQQAGARGDTGYALTLGGSLKF
ncbi:MAG: hypothetical protein F4057_08085 [Acidobacteria bacterium]|nr:hypothetical protein [Acidobacteriota bacterium]MYI75266.1 hypothetical protein [Acidobacteriota bacterium]